MKVNKVYRDFHLSEDEYHKHRNNLNDSHYVVKSESWCCRVLYFDGDGGVALFKNPCEIFDDGGEDAIENFSFVLKNRITQEIEKDPSPLLSLWQGLSSN